MLLVGTWVILPSHCLNNDSKYDSTLIELSQIMVTFRIIDVILFSFYGRIQIQRIWEFCSIQINSIFFSLLLFERKECHILYNASMRKLKCKVFLCFFALVIDKYHIVWDCARVNFDFYMKENTPTTPKKGFLTNKF